MKTHRTPLSVLAILAICAALGSPAPADAAMVYFISDKSTDDGLKTHLSTDLGHTVVARSGSAGSYADAGCDLSSGPGGCGNNNRADASDGGFAVAGFGSNNQASASGDNTIARADRGSGNLVSVTGDGSVGQNGAVGGTTYNDTSIVVNTTGAAPVTITATGDGFTYP